MGVKSMLVREFGKDHTAHETLLFAVKLLGLDESYVLGEEKNDGDTIAEEEQMVNDDSSDLTWITMNGSHFPIDPESKSIVGGAHGKFNGRRVNAYTDGPGCGTGNQKNENSTSGGKNEPGKKAESSKENKGKLYGGSWNNKEEYLEARKKAEEDYQKKSKEIDQKRKDFKNEEARINSDAEKEKEEISKKWDSGELSVSEALDEYSKVNEKANSLINQKAFELDEESKKARQEYSEVFDPEYEFEKLDKPHKPELGKEMSIVNPKGLSNNCQRCCVAEELRYRGYDVVVTDGSTETHVYDGLSDLQAVSNCFILNDPQNDSVRFDINKFGQYNEEALNKMKEWGDGARALVWYDSPDENHLFNLVNDGGTIVCVDNVHGLVCSDKDEGGLFLGIASNATSCGMIRVDKAKLTTNTLLYCQRRDEAQ